MDVQAGAAVVDEVLVIIAAQVVLKHFEISVVSSQGFPVGCIDAVAQRLEECVEFRGHVFALVLCEIDARFE